MRIILPVLLILSLSACDRKSPPTVTVPTAKSHNTLLNEQAAAARLDAPIAPLTPLAQLGKKIFFDETLSGSGHMSCASCHNPQNAYAPLNNLAAQLGGTDLARQGGRAVPSLTYHERTPTFKVMPDTQLDIDDGATLKAPRLAQKTLSDAEISKAISEGHANTVNVVHADTVVPLGGFDLDGRAVSLADQASGPLFDAREMANSNIRSLQKKLAAAPYAREMVAVFGKNALGLPEQAVRNATKALEQFQLEDHSFHSYNSKFDYVLAGRAQFNDQETRGWTLFDDPKKGNCAACHLDKPTKNRMAPAFTDYQYEALAAPRNSDLRANQNPDFFDTGLCGPNRNDLAGQSGFCGMFKTPSLRNVATRRVFFHNGVFHSLEDVVRFYVERDTRPEKWYPKRADGSVEMFNDLPVAYRANVDVGDAPFNRHQGEQPALSNQEIDDLVAFLKTLTDGYK